MALRWRPLLAKFLLQRPAVWADVAYRVGDASITARSGCSHPFVKTSPNPPNPSGSGGSVRESDDPGFASSVAIAKECTVLGGQGPPGAR